MTIDRLDALLNRFRVSARMFHSGPLCGINDFEPRHGLGQLHLIQRGELRIEHQRAETLCIDAPSLLFYPRPFWHRFVSDEQVGADMACAHLQFEQGPDNPLVHSLPAFVLLRLDQLDGMQPLLELLFREAFEQRCGRLAIIDRLFEVVLVQLLRHLLDRGTVTTGLLAGLSHPQLARSLVAMHAEPQRAWSLASLAAMAGMSRSVYAATFRRVLGTTPGEHVARWRLGLAKQALREGRSLKSIAVELGYSSDAVLSRAFRTTFGIAPRAWLVQQRDGTTADPAARAR